jgi:hypothetical protein
MNDRTSAGHSDRPRLVRPRWIWIGVALGVIGIVATGIGLMAQSWPTVVVGVAALVLGAASALAGGVMRDVHSSRSLSQEVQDVGEGNAHEGTVPGQSIDDPDIRKSAAAIERERAQRLDAAEGSMLEPRTERHRHS